MKNHKQKPDRHGSFRRISYRDRVTIENRHCIDKKSVGQIAKELGKNKSSITREIAGRPRIGKGKYSADLAQEKTQEKRDNQGRSKNLLEEQLLEYVVSKLEWGWSPEQIACRLPREYPDNEKMRVCHEAIYQYIYSQIHRGGHGKVKEGCKDLRGYLARKHTKRQKKGFRKVQKMYKSTLPSIEDRPPEVDERKELGHWEDDTLVSRKSKNRVKSVNERASGIVFFGRTSDGSASECDKVVKNRLSGLPKKYRKTLTRDRGTENLEYRSLEKDLKISCYFAHPYCSHERGSNENTNGLFRRYFPKGADFSKVTDQQLAEIEHLLNTRPRKRLGGLTPYEVFYQITGVALDS